MKKFKFTSLLLLMALLMGTQQAWAFCGFYVAKADAKLFNKSSQIILARDGDHTVITMSSDYSGDAKDFAMVVPVPEVLKKDDIRVVQQYIFDKFDTYTAPRLVEYWDATPCSYPTRTYSSAKETMAVPSSDDMVEMKQSARKAGVKIEAKYTVGEYDILILSAKESTGLKTWLTDNGYQIPSGAEEVLDPYIRDNMKFFVVKVNLEQQKALGIQTLRPLQIQFNSSRFMLPIRLGMANAESAQDMIVYAFTKKGRVETVNYRTTKLPTDREIPEFVQTEGLFGEFYKATFERAWDREGRNSVMLEYAWDVSSQQQVKCDPCPAPPITFAEMREAGVWWVSPDQWNGSYIGDLFVTRLHVRYARSTFPQDLLFTNTPEQANFQGRYVIHHAATGPLDCPEGKKYKVELRNRRQKELHELAALTGWSTSKWSSYLGSVIAPDPVIDTDPTPIDTYVRRNLPQIGMTDTFRNLQIIAPTLLGQVPPTQLASLVMDEPLLETEVAMEEPGSATLDSATGLVNEAESIAVSNTFLANAATDAQAGSSKKTWLFGIAGLMFVIGIAVRVSGRRQKKNT